MRSRRFAALTIPALALALAFPATAHAGDKTGSAGKAKTIEVNSPSADKYLQFHGRVFVKSGKSTTEYRWGGTACGSRTMTPEMVQLLVDTVRSDADIRLVPTYQKGQGSSKCLVGFRLQKKSHNNGNGHGHARGRR